MDIYREPGPPPRRIIPLAVPIEQVPVIVWVRPIEACVQVGIVEEELPNDLASLVHALVARNTVLVECSQSMLVFVAVDPRLRAGQRATWSAHVYRKPRERNAEENRGDAQHSPTTALDLTLFDEWFVFLLADNWRSLRLSL
eukprot:CAMPEP_0177165934 /NCGR_PEP_ID=MMETSP0367-20130122/7766_1 /TAXON_ID=447022 ORGANISM="Scrippsiella hangoei-like, Strain SHHI-4" /NCGR_SAMPLE_ID=MMETSP0367 /ASSEMBLY_ACC=CAM_ASM_000362 /LENGTH=141 /DNA_ID=CAMNT_0018611971 /DNA_START=769 /DNA_END=1191 /DNA_ORIENTATION=-